MNPQNATIKYENGTKCVIPKGPEGNKIPKSVECSANKWATDTAKGLANAVSNNPQEQQKAYHNLKNKLSKSEVKWEKDWYNGIRQSAGLNNNSQ